MNKLKVFRNDRNWHPEGGDLLCYLDGEQPAGKAARIRSHLEACWTCRAEAEKIGHTISSFTQYRNEVLLPALSVKTDSGGQFRNRLHALAITSLAERRPWAAMVERVRNLAPNRWQVRIAIPCSAVALVLIVAIVASQVWPPVVNAQQLLAKASALETARENDPAIVSHRFLRFEKRRSKDGALLSRRRVDIWHSGKQGATARRVYDEAGKLVAGEWSEKNGASELFEAAGKGYFRTRDDVPQGVLAAPDELWRFDLNAGTFEGLVPILSDVRVEKRGAEYLVHYKPDSSQTTGNLLDATLSVRRTDLRTVGLEITVRSEAPNGASGVAAGPLVYELAEDGFEQKPVAAVNASVFAPDAELVAVQRPEEQSWATVELQLQTTFLLDGIGATLGQEVTANIGEDHRLHVEGVAVTESRRSEILAALAPVRSLPAVTVNILTAAEAVRRARSNFSVIRTIDRQPENRAIPVSDDLLRYFESHLTPGSPANIQENIRHYSQQVLADSNEAMRHAWVMQRVTGIVEPRPIGELPPEIREEYLCMLATHARTVEQRSAKLQRGLAPVFFAGLSVAEEASAPEDISDLSAAVRKLFDVVSRNDRTVQSNFSLIAGAGPEHAANLRELRGSLLKTQQLAHWVYRQANTTSCKSPQGGN